MPAITPYAKSLSGISEKVFVVPNIAYTAQTTFANFVNSAAVADGEIGVFLDTGAVRTTLLTSGLNFFIAQKRDGAIHRTPTINYGSLNRSNRQAYTAPVPKIVSIGYNNTNTTSDMGFNFSSASPTNTVTFGIAVRETTPGNQPFPVQEGYATVTSSTQDQYTVLSQIVSQINLDLDYERRTAPDAFCYGEIQTNASNAAITVAATLSVTNGTNTVVFNAAPTGAPAVGGLIAIGGTANTGVVYKVTAIAADNVTYTLDRIYQGATNATLAIANVLNVNGYVSGTSKLGVRFTGKTTVGGITNNPTFIVAGSFNLINAPVLTTQNWLLGSGYGQSIVELEAREGAIFEGVGSTINAAFAADYGQPTRYGSTALTYDQIFLVFANTINPGANPVDFQTTQYERIHICTVVGSTSGSTLQTVFGL